MCERVEATKAQVFILESPSIADEVYNRRDGKILYDFLKLKGLKPLYCNIGNSSDIEEAIECFYNSGYRYLHLCCHGNDDSICLGKTSFAYEELDFFEGMMHHRRLFISACLLGNINFAKRLFNNNEEMYSILAPTDEIAFSTSLTFFSSLYHLLNECNSRSIKRDSFQFTIERLCETFGQEFSYYSRGSEVKEKKFSNKNWHNQLLSLNPKNSSM